MNTRYLLQLIKFGKINSLSYLVSYSLVCRRNPFMDTTAVLYMLNLMLSFGVILTIDFQAYNNFFFVSVSKLYACGRSRLDQKLAWILVNKTVKQFSEIHENNLSMI